MSSEEGESDIDQEFDDLPIAEHAVNLLERAKHAISCLQQKIRSVEHNDVQVACILMEETAFCDDLAFVHNCMDELKQSSHQLAEDKWQELSDYLVGYDDNHNALEKEIFWYRFNEKLKELGKGSIDFRKTCFHRSTEEEYTIFHLVCKLDPPTQIMQTLIDIIPSYEGERGFYRSKYSHLSVSYGKYPLHIVLQNGGSLELVKFLIKIDPEKKSMSMDYYYDNVDNLLHILISNREKYKPPRFYSILEFVTLSLGKQKLLTKKDSAGLTPIGKLFNILEEEGLTNKEILANKDFDFLLRATTYEYKYGNSYQGKKIHEDFDGRKRDIDNISASYAFLICSPCFKRETSTAVLEHLSMIDKSFLIERDQDGIYPVHGVLQNVYGYCVYDGGYEALVDFNDYLVRTILRLAPECARLKNRHGRIPLHVVADREWTSSLFDETRLSIVQAFWKAYPDAAGIMVNDGQDNHLPPFALPERYDSYYHYSKRERQRYSGISSTYFLLRQRPDMIAATISMIQRENDEAVEPSAKRPKQGG